MLPASPRLACLRHWKPKLMEEKWLQFEGAALEVCKLKWRTWRRWQSCSLSFSSVLCNGESMGTSGGQSFSVHKTTDWRQRPPGTSPPDHSPRVAPLVLQCHSLMDDALTSSWSEAWAELEQDWKRRNTDMHSLTVVIFVSQASRRSGSCLLLHSKNAGAWTWLWAWNKELTKKFLSASLALFFQKRFLSPLPSPPFHTEEGFGSAFRASKKITATSFQQEALSGGI